MMKVDVVVMPIRTSECRAHNRKGIGSRSRWIVSIRLLNVNYMKVSIDFLFVDDRSGRNQKINVVQSVLKGPMIVHEGLINFQIQINLVRVRLGIVISVVQGPASQGALTASKILADVKQRLALGSSLGRMASGVAMIVMDVVVIMTKGKGKAWAG